MTATPPRPPSTVAPRIGRAGARKILAVEGIRLPAESRRMFRDFDRRGLSAEERRRAILAKHAAAAADG